MIDRADEFEIACPFVISLQQPEHQRRFVLLNRQLKLSIADPGVPAGSDRAVGVVLVKKIALLLDDAVCEEQKRSGQFVEAGTVHGIADQGPVPGPHVRVVIAVAVLNVGIIGGQNCPVAVALRPDDQQRLFVELDDVVRQVGEVVVLLVHPGRPERSRSPDESRRPLLPHRGVEVADFSITLPGAHPVKNCLCSRRRQRHAYGHRGIDRPLSNRVH